jgi:hypothetical protein
VDVSTLNGLLSVHKYARAASRPVSTHGNGTTRHHPSIGLATDPTVIRIGIHTIGILAHIHHCISVCIALIIFTLALAGIERNIVIAIRCRCRHQHHCRVIVIV